MTTLHHAQIAGENMDRLLQNPRDPISVRAVLRSAMRYCNEQWDGEDVDFTLPEVDSFFTAMLSLNTAYLSVW